MTDKPAPNNDGIVLIGDKPLFKYITACVEQYRFEGRGSVTIKARGKNITQAVNVAAILCRDYLADKVTKDIDINSEVYPSKKNSNEKVRISTIIIKITGIK